MHTDVPDPADTGVPIAVAARTLGITPAAVRQRIRRGSLHAGKVGEQWRVILPVEHAERNAVESDVPPAYRELIEQLRSENTFLRDQLAMQQRITAGLMQRVPQLTAGSDNQDEAHEHGHDGDGRRRRSWWRFWR